MIDIRLKVIKVQGDGHAMLELPPNRQVNDLAYEAFFGASKYDWDREQEESRLVGPSQHHLLILSSKLWPSQSIILALKEFENHFS